MQNINEIISLGLARIRADKKLLVNRGEKLFVDRTYCLRETLPKQLYGKSFVYSEIDEVEATVESDGFVVAITPSNFTEIQRALRKNGFTTVIERGEPIGFHPIGATLMTETVTYYAKYCRCGERLSFSDKWVILIGESDDEYYQYNWVKTPASLLTGDALNGYDVKSRLWHGIPSIERTKGGRLYSSYGSGNECEPRLDNYVVFSYSDDGEKWKEFCVAVHPDRHDSRVFDASLWIDPLDRLWLFWSQACEHEDGRMGVWFVRIDNPDDGIDNIIEKIKEATPKRIVDGIKLNKPVVLSDGSWMFASVNVACDELDNICVSVDDGESWMVRSSPEVNGCQHADEPMILEVEKGRLKTFVRSTDGTGIRVIESSDNGYTWTKSVDSGLDGPCSRFHIRRLSSGKVLLINHYAFTGRSHLTAMLSTDNGQTYPYRMLLDERGGVSYPDAVERDGRIYLTWDYDRNKTGEILFTSFTEEEIMRSDRLDRSRITVITKNPK